MVSSSNPCISNVIEAVRKTPLPYDFHNVQPPSHTRRAPATRRYSSVLVKTHTGGSHGDPGCLFASSSSYGLRTLIDAGLQIISEILAFRTLLVACFVIKRLKRSTISLWVVSSLGKFGTM